MLRNSSSTRFYCRASQSLASSNVVHTTTLRTRALNPTPTTREFHASFPSHESARRQAARLRKSNAQTKRVEDARKAKESRPHPALGYAPGNESLWKDSKLCKLLVTEETVRQLPVPSLEMEMVPEIVRVKGPHGRFLYDHKNDRPETETTGRMVPKVAEGWPVVLKHGTPQLLNYGVGNSEMDMIKKVSFLRPAASLIRLEDAEAHRETQQRVEGKGAVWSGDQTSLEQILEQHKWQTSRETNLQYWFGRLIDLKNASAQGLEFENKMRIVAAFSSQGKPHDPGLPEVQAALKTYRIHVLWGHLQTKKKDIQNRRRLVMMIHERAKILRYLRKTYRARYEALLPQLGLEREAVEGHLQLNRQLEPA